jgi:RimJ/RimL family protein N-acetyltransferase
MPLSLKPLDDRHLPGMEEIVADPDALRFTRIPEPAPPGFAATWLGRYRGHERVGFAIEDEGGAFLGLALAPDIDRHGREVELGYIVHPAARGRGVATQGLVLLTRWAFDELGALRAYLFIDSENVASLRVAERAGYVREGRLRSVHVKQGLRADSELWSRLPSDPEPASG